jgi:hypothetical protein
MARPMLRSLDLLLPATIKVRRKDNSDPRNQAKVDNLNLTDRNITVGDNAVILAWGDDDTKTISYHGSNRLATVICFWDCPPETVTPVDNTIKLMMPNTLLPAQRTTYLCYSLPFETPNVCKRFAVVSYSSLIFVTARRCSRY